MSQWQQWKKIRSVSEGLGDIGDPAKNFKFNDEQDDFGEDHEKNRTELFKIVFDKYPEETMNFLDTIAQRGDEEVVGLLRKIGGSHNYRSSQEPRHPKYEKDQFVPAGADVAHNPEGGD